VQSELLREEAVYSEMESHFKYDRDKRVDFMNAWGYRTNGALWAVAEALDIPTYARPRYSISSGTIGIIAGLVPSAFSLYAMQESGGGKHERSPHPNMLCKPFGYPVTNDIDYPETVWTWMNSAPPHDPQQIKRLDFIKDWWRRDKNLRFFAKNQDKDDIELLLGLRQDKLTIQLTTDRLAMVRHLHALTMQMERPLLELMMIVRGAKSFQ
jgi:hypothetical protein